LFDGELPRIVEIKGIPMDASLGKYMLYVTNADKPGLIGGLGTLFGNAGINIATFHLGRATAGSDAIALVEVDLPIPKIIVDAVRKMPQVMQAKPLTF
jgi:D-3-phosphoglycerate dehydrogenase